MWLRSILILAVLVIFTTPTLADDYITPGWTDLLRTIIRFNAMPITTDMALLDEYAQVSECDLYKAFYHDDFKWNKVRQAMIQSIKDNIATYPTRYRYVAVRQLDRYDFQTKMFKFTNKSVISNVNSFVIYAVQGSPCENGKISFLPHSFRAVVPEPIYMDGLPIGEEEAKNLIEYMNAHGDAERLIWLRFNMRMVYIDPLTKSATDGTGIYHYEQGKTPATDTVKLDARIEAIDAFEDEALTKLIYSVQL